MRLSDEIEYETEHGDSDVKLIATWAVPYEGESQGGVVKTIGPDDGVRMTKLVMKSNGIIRELALPQGPFLDGFIKGYEKAIKGCDAEFRELFTEHANGSYAIKAEARLAQRTRELAAK